MKITNVTGLPAAVVDKVSVPDRPWEKGRISVTQLLKAPQVAHLERQHWGDIQEDASDRLYRVMGQLVHALFGEERSDTIQEERLDMELGGWTLTGQMDSVDDPPDKAGFRLTDYKYTTVYSIIYGRPEWEQQLNFYAMLLREHGFGADLKTIQNICFVRDWKWGDYQNALQRAKAKGLTSDYPTAQIVTVPAKLWPVQSQRAHAIERLRDHQAAWEGNVRPCNAEERWEETTKYAVTKAGNKRATRVVEDYDEAIGIAEELTQKTNKEYNIVERPGSWAKCASLHWCRVWPWCPQWTTENQRLIDSGFYKEEEPE